jgi:ABC-type branched-subunit amino acid transport system ATPase component
MKLGAAIRAALRFLDRRDRRLLAVATVLQMSISVLDLVGVILLGVVGALAISASNGQSPPDAVDRVVSLFGLGHSSNTSVIAVLAVVAAGLLLTKSLLSPYLLSRVFRFLARREAMVSARLTRALLAQPLTFVQKRSSQQTSSALIGGANATTIQILGQMVVAAGELALLLLLTVALVVVKPFVALGAVLFFALVGVALQQALGQRSTDFAAQRRRTDVSSLVAIQEALGAYREITVSDRRSLYVDRLEALRQNAAAASAGTNLVSVLPKYISELAMVLGGCALAAILFTTEPIAAAAGTFAMFLAAATRAMPSLLRLQAAALMIRAAAGWAAPTFALADDLGPALDTGPAESTVASPDRDHAFVPRIDVSGVSFAYAPGIPALHDVSIAVDEGQSIALVGRSGAGKSTLADVILGVLEPETGEVTVSGVPPGDAVRRWPGSIAYVPQDVMLSDDSLRANVALGLPRDIVDDEQVWDALRAARLDDYVRAQPDGLDTLIGERGLRLSGGQRQRLGIARALFTKPRLLILDEATSSLDAETEQAITDMLEDLDRDVTTVIIAHRLSTVRHADRVVYLEEGRTAAVGTFDEVCAAVPALRRQADLMGLRPA